MGKKNFRQDSIKGTITVFFPCYNDEKTIAELVIAAEQILKQHGKDYEILVIDDGSTDQSRTVLLDLKKKIPSLKLIFHDTNKGYGGALITGFKHASKDLVFYTDGDGQYDVKELPLLLNLMTSDVNFVNGLKMTRDDPSYRVFLGNVYNFFARWAFWLPIFDVDCDFRLLRRSLIQKLDLHLTSGAICIELVKKAERAGAVFRQVSIHHYKRIWGESQFFRPGKILSTFKDFALLWMQLMPQQYINRMFSNPTIFTFVRRLLEHNFTGEKKVIKQELSLDGKTLDIGCGTGEFCTLFAKETYLGIDLSEQYIAYARKRYPYTFAVGDATQLQIKGLWDNILICGVFHHLSDAEITTILHKTEKLLTPQGRILVIEDIPTQSFFNIIGELVHYFDVGKHIRTHEQYGRLYNPIFQIVKNYTMRSGVCDYSVYVLEVRKSR